MSSRIRIAIDTLFFNNPYSGITRVWEIILTNLKTFRPLETHPDENQYAIPYEIILLIRGNTISPTLEKIIKSKSILEDVKFEYLYIREFNYITMYQDIDYLNFICKTHAIDYFLSTYYTFCTVIPNILMIHDMIPEIYNLPKNHMWIQKDLAIKNASQFITISNTTTTDLIKFYPHLKINKYPINIIYNSIPQSNHLEYDDDFLNNILIPNGILPKKYIFAITTNNEEYKNNKLIQNFANKYHSQLSTKLDTKISIIFLIKQNLPNGCIISNGILYLSNISNKALHTLYKNALCYVNVSQYEGFGLPIFEAFSHSIPVIALKIPVYCELANNAINYIEDDVSDLFDKICYIYKYHRNNNTNPDNNIDKRIANGFALIKQYSVEKQLGNIHKLFSGLSGSFARDEGVGFMNIILQTYDECNLERKKELKYCIKKNLDNPYIAYIHDFGYDSEKYLPEYILNHPKYINIYTHRNNSSDKSSNDIIPKVWLTYENAIKYSNKLECIQKYGSYWGIINCDIFLDSNSNWLLMRGQLNNDFIFAQSRHEFNILENSGKSTSVMDKNFAQLYHCNTQDGWFYKTPLNILTECTHNNTIGIHNEYDKKFDINFEIGFLGCDNAIADRLRKFGYNIINQPETYKIMHYDIIRGKNSSNYLDKHMTNNKTDNHKPNNKPDNKHPEINGCYLVPNYDQLLNYNIGNGEIDLASMINKLGGISNWEKYKIISELLSTRIIINNPK
jgi:hypothetical protein